MKNKKALVFVVLVVGLVAAVIVAMGAGAVRVPPVSLLRLLLRAIGFHAVTAPSDQDVTILLFLRLPRIVVAVLAGSSLAVCGVVMQGLFRNPMASPEILGISSGSSLGAVIAITTGLSAASLLVLPAFTMIGALLAAAVIYLISTSRGTTSLLFIVIAGMAISSLFNGLTSAFLMLSREYEVSQFVFWTMGGLDGRTWQHVALSAPVLIPGMLVLSGFSRELNLFTLGEESASSLGMRVEISKRLLLALAAVITGVSISVCGPIGFVGLLIPHLFRFLVGADHRSLLP
ncbi:MAG: iron ABC transporter permease, partial [Spirochaetia bacterium]